jgi:hypothetical protein
MLVIGAVVAIRLFDDGQKVERNGLMFASGELASALERGGSGTQLRELATFADADGTTCRAFLSRDTSGIACKERGGWHLRVTRNGVALDDPAAVAATEAAILKAAGAMRSQ